MKNSLFIFFILIFFSGCETEMVIEQEKRIIEYINNLEIDNRSKDLLLEVVYSGTQFILDPNNQELITELTDKSFEFQDKIVKLNQDINKESPE